MFLLTLLGMLKDGHAIRMLFGSDRETELETENAYRHAGTEYRLNNKELIEQASVSTHNPLLGWLEHVLHKIKSRLIDKVTGYDHLDEALRLGHYHELQAVLCELDSKSKSRTRGLQGPLGVSKNMNLKNYHGTASPRVAS